MTSRALGTLRVSASPIWIGAGSFGSRRLKRSSRFSPACWRPAVNSAIGPSAVIATMAVVNRPVRSGSQSSPFASRFAPHPLQNPDVAVVVVEHRSLGSESRKLVIDGPKRRSALAHDLPLGRGRHGGLEIALEPLQAM